MGIDHHIALKIRQCIVHSLDGLIYLESNGIMNRLKDATEMEVKLRVDFQDGFSDDTVIIKINGNEVHTATNVTTDVALSYAAYFEDRFQSGKMEFEIHVPTKNLKHSFTFDLEMDMYLGISILGGELRFRSSDKRFMYC